MTWTLENAWIPVCVGLVPSEHHPGKYHLILGPGRPQNQEQLDNAIDVGSYEEIYERIDNTEIS